MNTKTKRKFKSTHFFLTILVNIYRLFSEFLKDFLESLHLAKTLTKTERILELFRIFFKQFM